jgi:phosphoenolpyruvate phosphomutase
MARWSGGCPIVAVPTTYYRTPVAELGRAGVRLVIWANHLLRGSITAMQEIAATVRRQGSVAPVEERIAPLAEVFRLQDEDELARAEESYLPGREALGGAAASARAKRWPVSRAS